MAASPSDDRFQEPEDVAGTGQIHPLKAAALVGGALAATAGAYYGTRALARRNGAQGGKVSSVMATAMTACDLAHGAPANKPTARAR
jgi:cytochrome bd-type quinol oxidase subunit 1